MATTNAQWQEEEREAPISREAMRDAALPLHSRDYCAHLLAPLNKCREETYYLPWKCSHERHEYERCEYVELLRRERWMAQQLKSE